MLISGKVSKLRNTNEYDRAKLTNIPPNANDTHVSVTL